jgi:ubiquinol oxidase
MTSVPAVGPISAAVVDRPPFGPMEHLPHDRLVAEQRTSAESPRRIYSLSARALFAVMDKLYGAPRTLEKFRVLELVARVPYQAWENVAYVAVTHTARQHGFARRVFDRVRTARWEQDNEQWHLLILEELSRDEPRSGFVRSRVIPQILAFAYYQLSWFMFVIRPAYAYLVDEHPEWEGLPYDGEFVSDFGDYDSLADLFRQIGYDERLHKQESEVRMGDPRFT